MHGVAGSHTWSVAFLSPGSGVMRGSVTLNGVGSLIAAGSGSAAAVGSGKHSVLRDGEGRQKKTVHYSPAPTPHKRRNSP